VSLLDSIKEQACKLPQRIIFPEGDDETMMRAAAQAVDEGFAKSILVGDEAALRSLCDGRGIPQQTFQFVSNADRDYLESLAERYALMPGTMLGKKAILRRMLEDNLAIALVVEAVGDADATFAGINISTGEVIMSAQMIIGLADGTDIVSSVALGKVPDCPYGENGAIAFGDCAVVVQPTVGELATIAISSCDTIRVLMGWEPRCALLSFSTCGSGANDLSRKVADAVKVANDRRPDLKIDGEFQLDSAINPDVALRKVHQESEVAGKANVLIFPDLNAGNIGVKIMQGFAHVDAVGPFLQGFRKVVSDCSRSANQRELVGNIAVTSLRAARLNEAGE